MEFLKIIPSFFIGLLYPQVCGICGKAGEPWLCRKCKNKIKQEEKNLHISYFSCDYEEAFYLFSYEGIIKNALIDYKFNQKPYLFRTFSKIIRNNEKACRFLKKYDIIIPIPIHPTRKQKRGYNQSELIAREIASNLGLRMIKNGLIKTKNIAPQSSLKKEARKQNVKGVYKVKNTEKIQGKKIILIDDIYTTGSTVAECSKILKKAGAGNIGILTIAKD